MSDQTLLQSCLAVAQEAATEAGLCIATAFSSDKQVENKYDNNVDLVTETDKECEEKIVSKIRQAFPAHKFIGEEESSKSGTPELTDDPTWMIDPLDGTTNFVHGFPFVCVSIGLTINKEVVLGVVHNPILGETFTAIKGCGAFLNGKPIRCSEHSSLAKCLLATEVGVSRDESSMKAIMGRVQAVVSKCRGVRCAGSCAMNMCGVAMGRLDAFYEIGFGGPWDCAGASCILKEAGGAVLDPAGGPFNVMSRRVLASNQHLGPQIASVIATIPDGDSEPHALG